jgi:hypothetical protein
VKRYAPATERNREPIATVLAEELPAAGRVLEVASGSGEHALHFARRFPSLEWLPSDPDPLARQSIAAWREQADQPNLLPPLDLDAGATAWPLSHADAVLCINMVHISACSAAEGLAAGAGSLLPPDAPLVLYGPWLEGDVLTAASNVEFDASLRARYAEWGLRKVAWFDDLAQRYGLARTRRVAMPANNLLLVYRRR